MGKYTSMIIDIKKSRTYNESERFDIQEKLISIVKFANNYYKDDLVKKIEFSSGDSIQALFKSAAGAFSCYCLIRNLFYPYQIRCGLGFGRINQRFLDNDYRNSNMLDGEAYHFAIKALNNCKLYNYCFLICSRDFEKDQLVNQIMSTVELFNLDHTPKQADVFNLFNVLIPLEIKTNNQNLNVNSHFIMNILKQNVLSYDFKEYTPKKIKELLLDEINYNLIIDDSENRGFFEPGFSTKINVICSILLGVTRQNVEKMRIAGKFDEIRKLEKIVLSNIKKEYKEGNEWVF